MRFFILSICLTFPALISASDDLTHSASVKKWINHQCSVRSVTAKFKQERRIKALKKPIINEGQLWFKSPDLFRWELGRPVESLAINRNGELLLLRPLKKIGERHELTKSKNRNRPPGLLFFDIGFTASHEEFSEKFTVTDAAIKDGSYFFTLNANDFKTKLALRKIVFQVDSKSFFTQNITLRFRDSSSVSTTFAEVKENVKVNTAVFNVDLTGYTITGND